MSKELPPLSLLDPDDFSPERLHEFSSDFCKGKRGFVNHVPLHTNPDMVVRTEDLIALAIIEPLL